MVQVARLQSGPGSLIQDHGQGSGTKRNGRNGEKWSRAIHANSVAREKQWRGNVVYVEVGR